MTSKQKKLKKKNMAKNKDKYDWVAGFVFLSMLFILVSIIFKIPPYNKDSCTSDPNAEGCICDLKEEDRYGGYLICMRSTTSGARSFEGITETELNNLKEEYKDDCDTYFSISANQVSVGKCIQSHLPDECEKNNTKFILTHPDNNTDYCKRKDIYDENCSAIGEAILKNGVYCKNKNKFINPESLKYICFSSIPTNDLVDIFKQKCVDR